MKLQQLKYLLAIVDSGLNITAAAERLFTSQPGVSKQIKLLEQELGVTLFTRKGKSLGDITPEGHEVISRARAIMQEVEGIRGLSSKLYLEQTGSLSIGTTHTQARYVLPDVIRKFREVYPDVTLNLHQGTSEQIENMVTDKQIDFAIATGARGLFDPLLLLPCYHWDRVVIVPKTHELAQLTEKPTLAQLAQYPLVTYVFSFNAESSLKRAFKDAGFDPEVVFTARDADVIKTYVRMGLGVGVVANMASDCDEESDLKALNAEGLFPRCTTWIGFRKDIALRKYMYDFIELFAPHLDEQLVRRAYAEPDQASVDLMFDGQKLPVKGPCARTLAYAA